jgi:hypothetical protein
VAPRRGTNDMNSRGDCDRIDTILLDSHCCRTLLHLRGLRARARERERVFAEKLWKRERGFGFIGLTFDTHQCLYIQSRVSRTFAVTTRLLSSGLSLLVVFTFYVAHTSLFLCWLFITFAYFSVKTAGDTTTRSTETTGGDGWRRRRSSPGSRQQHFAILHG